MQGVAAAIIAPAALSILTITFREGPDRNKALGIWGGLGGVGATAGLLLGGVIIDGLGWPWIFFVNVPFGIAVLAIVPALLRESRVADPPRSFDVAGAATVTVALALLVYAIITIPDAGWASRRTIGLFLAAVLLAVLFVLVETRSAVPLVPFRALRSRILVDGNLLILLTGMSVAGMLITLTSYVQRVLEWSAIQFGLAAAVMTVTGVGGTMVGQHAVTRFGTRPVATSGSVLLGAACLLLTFATDDAGTPGLMLAALFVFGAGLAGAFVSAQIAALTGVAEETSGLAAGLVDTSFNIGTAFGVAVCTSVALTRTEAIDGPALPTLTVGYQAAFGAAAAFAVLGLAVALTLLGRTAGPRPGRTDDAPADSD